MKLTKSVIDKTLYTGQGNSRHVIWDAEISGFGLRLFPTGRKSFVLSYRHQGRKKLLTLGQYDVITVDQARKEAKIKIGEVAKGSDPLGEKKKSARTESVKQLCQTYLNLHSKIHKKSWREDERRIHRHIIPRIGNLRVTSVNTIDCANLHLKIGETAKYEANRCIELLRGIFEKGRAWGFISSMAVNPAKGVKRFKEDKRDRWLTHEELPRLAVAIAKNQNIYIRGALWLYLLTGVRKSELLKARWEDIDFFRKELRIRETKSGNDHIVPLSTPAIDILKSLPRLSGNPFVIVGQKTGSPLVNINKAWRKIRKDADVEDVRLHDLRRTLGSWLAQTGSTLHMIGKILNHSDSKTTQVYAHFSQQSIRKALEEHADNLKKIGNVKLVRIVNE